METDQPLIYDTTINSNPEVKELPSELTDYAILAYLDAYGHQDGKHGWAEGFTHPECNQTTGSKIAIPFESALPEDYQGIKYKPLWEMVNNGLVTVDNKDQRCFCPRCNRVVTDATLFTSPDYIKKHVIQKDNPKSTFLISTNQDSEGFPVTGFAAGEIVGQSEIRSRILREYFGINEDVSQYEAILDKYWNQIIDSPDIPVFWFADIGTPPCFRNVQTEIDLNKALLEWANYQMEEAGVPEEKRYLAAYVSTNVATYKITTGHGAEVVFVDPDTLDKDNKRVVILIPIENLRKIYNSTNVIRAFVGNRRKRTEQAQKLLSISGEVFNAKQEKEQN